MNLLKTKIEEILDFNEEDTSLTLRYCEFRALCGRNFAARHLMKPNAVRVRKQAGILLRGYTFVISGKTGYDEAVMSVFV